MAAAAREGFRRHNLQGNPSRRIFRQSLQELIRRVIFGAAQLQSQTEISEDLLLNTGLGTGIDRPKQSAAALHNDGQFSE